MSLALELGMFTCLDSFTRAERVAALLALSPVNTHLFLEFLASMGVLESAQGDHRPPSYRMHPAIRPYLHPDSALYVGDALLFRHKVLSRSREQLEVLLRKGVPGAESITAEAAQHTWAQAAQTQIAQEQRAVTVPVARRIAAQLPDHDQWRTMLDLGGGPGLVSIALAEDLPALSGTVFEYPAVAAVAQLNIEAAHLQDRLRGIGGDLLSDDFGCGYDLIWCSSVLHFVTCMEPVLQRLHAALNPGGVLVCCHAEVGAGSADNHRVLQYYLRMRMQGRQVLPAGELAERLHGAGFSEVTTFDDVVFPVAPVAVLIARKGRLFS